MKQVLLFFGLAANLTWWGLATPLLTLGQIVPDQTLPVNSIVTPEGQTHLITGGTSVNGILFHSFEQFSVPTGHSAIFNNEAQIRNILTRITGGTISEIDGLLRANGAANLFLLNPNGIVFGENARLDIGGSFFASTGSEFVFADGRTYSATTPNAPPLITVDVPLGVQFGPSPGAIVNRSQVAIPVDNQALPVGLQVSPGQSLMLLGGEVVLEGGLLTAPSGQIAIASMGENAQVTLNPTPRGIVLGHDGGGQRFQDIRLSGGAIVRTSAAVGGDIQIQGRQVSVQDGSVISTASFGAGNAGNLTIAATESVEVIGNSSKLEFIENILLPAGEFDLGILRNGGLFALALGEGAAGNIVIETGEFRANNGAIVTTTTTGNGVGGNLLVNATNSITLNNAGLLTGTAGTQDAGNLEINTGTLTLTDGAIVATPSLSSGRGGDLTVNASVVELSGISQENYQLPAPIFNTPSPLPSSLFTQALGTGNSGNLEINTQQLRLSGSAVISTSTLNAGTGGNLTINADRIDLNGLPSLGKLGILEQIVAASADPRAIDATLLQNGLFAVSFGPGNAGQLNINTRELNARNGATIAASAFQEGTGGNLTLTTPAQGSVNLSTGGILTGTVGIGDAGNLEINTGTLNLTDGAIIATPSLSPGRSGDLTVNASVVELRGISQEIYQLPAPIFNTPSPIPSSLFTQALGTGNSGNLEINTQQLRLSGEAAISTSTLNVGTGGNLTVNADTIELNGIPSLGKISILEQFFGASANLSAIDASLLRNGLFAVSFGPGNAGELKINTGDLRVTNGSIIAASAFQSGTGGNLTITTPPTGSVNLDNGGLLTGTVGTGRAGNLQVQAGQLELQQGGIISTSTVGPGLGGDLTVNANNIQLSGISEEGYALPIFVEGSGPIPSSLLTLTIGVDPANPSGKAGNLTINTQRLLLEDNAAISTSTLGAAGDAGDLTVTASSLIQIRGIGPLREPLQEIFNTSFNIANVRNGLFTSSLGSGKAGNITIQTRELLAENGSLISASSLSPSEGIEPLDGTENTAGTLTIRTSGGLVRLNDSGLLTGTVNQQNSGALTLETGQLVVENGSVVATTTLTQGDGGRLQINAESVVLRGISNEVPSGLFTLTFFGRGRAGDLEINTENFTAENGGLAASSTFGPGEGGNLTLNASNQVKLSGGIPPDGQFPSGLRADVLDELPPFVGNPPLGDQAENLGTGTPGNLTLNGGIILLQDQAAVQVSAGSVGDGGNLTVNAGVLALRGQSTMAADAGQGSGGAVEINTRQGIFAVDRATQITATSELGTQFSGRVDFNTPDVEAAQGLANLPENPIDPEDRVRSPLCSPTGDSTAGEFIITGRSGLPQTPSEAIESDGVRVELVSPADSVPNRSGAPRASATVEQAGALLTPPAKGLVVNAQGDVILTATAPNGLMSGTPWFTAECDRVRETTKNSDSSSR